MATLYISYIFSLNDILRVFIDQNNHVSWQTDMQPNKQREVISRKHELNKLSKTDESPHQKKQNIGVIVNQNRNITKKRKHRALRLVLRRFFKILSNPQFLTCKLTWECKMLNLLVRKIYLCSNTRWKLFLCALQTRSFCPVTIQRRKFWVCVQKGQQNAFNSISKSFEQLGSTQN